nr:hypothetical protein JCGZ_04137 [Ipomoea trifida]
MKRVFGVKKDKEPPPSIQDASDRKTQASTGDLCFIRQLLHRPTVYSLAGWSTPLSRSAVQSATTAALAPLFTTAQQSQQPPQLHLGVS